MNCKQREKLSERQELLLCKYNDCECNFLERFLAKRLIEMNPNAKKFATSLQTCCSESKKILSECGTKSVDLWSRVCARIEAEDRAAVMLGKRNVTEGREPFFEKFGLGRFGYGFAAASAAAVIAAVVILPSAFQNSYTNGQQVASAGSNSNGNIHFVGASAASEPIQILEKRVPSTVEVDWMKSAGSVRMMNERSDRSPFLWIKVRKKDGSSVLRGERNSNGVVMMEDRTPLALSVSSR